MADIQTMEKNGALGYVLSGTESEQGFLFVLHGNHIAVHNEQGLDWREALSPDEKLKVFNKILADFRTMRTVGDGGFKLAALGVTEDGGIYISGNAGEGQSSDSFQRLCAERSMVKIASELASDQEMGGDPDAEPKLLNFESVYLMGGKPPQIPVACPCGDCTDMLAKRMPRDGQIVVIPSNDGEQDLTINQRAEYADGLRPGQVWDTTIGHFNRHRTIDLGAKADVQRDALDAFAEELSGPLSNAFKQGGEEPIKLLRSYRSATAPLSDASEVMNMNRRGNPHFINRFMAAQIKSTVLERLQGVIARNGAADLSPEGVKQLIADHIRDVRCIVVEMDNGKRYHAIATRVPGVDNALPPGEIGALFAAMGETGTNGICRVYGMDFNPSHIERGLLGTPPKQAIERLVKRRSEETDQVEMTFMPYNNGDISPPRVEALMRSFDARELFPGYFTGKNVEKEWVHQLDRGAGCSRC